MMDKVRINRLIVSVTLPGMHLQPNNDALARQVTRETNKEMVQVCAQYPSLCGFFASLPLAHVQESLAEIDYALDELGAVIFVVLTNVYGIYLGDLTMAPVFTKLNEWNAILFIILQVVVALMRLLVASRRVSSPYTGIRF